METKEKFYVEIKDGSHTYRFLFDEKPEFNLKEWAAQMMSCYSGLDVDEWRDSVYVYTESIKVKGKKDYSFD